MAAAKLWKIGHSAANRRMQQSWFSRVAQVYDRRQVGRFFGRYAAA
jgi:hypothetical protein